MPLVAGTQEQTEQEQLLRRVLATRPLEIQLFMHSGSKAHLKLRMTAKVAQVLLPAPSRLVVHSLFAPHLHGQVTHSWAGLQLHQVVLQLPLHTHLELHRTSLFMHSGVETPYTP